jgi:hypothetical protein
MDSSTRLALYFNAHQSGQMSMVQVLGKFTVIVGLFEL